MVFKKLHRNGLKLVKAKDKMWSNYRPFMN